MLLKIEVFPPAGNASSGKASQTLYVSPSTVTNRYGRNSDSDDDDDATDQEEEETNPNAGLVATIGRKGDVDILFGTDRSISRQHALLRLVASKPKKPKRKARGKAANSNNKEQGCFVEPRNDNEQSACDESQYGMCLVLENKGKSGSYIPSRDESTETETIENEKSKDGHDSDATTDDEGASANIPQSSQRNFGTATSLTTQLGEVIVSRSKLSSSQKLPALSDAIQEHFGQETPIQLTKLDTDESQVLKLDGSLGRDEKDLSVLVQFGCALLPTIKITLIPMMVVFSSGIPSSIQESLRLCGGLSQEAGTLPRLANNEDPTGTTHLVATERVAVAKQLIAWCYGVPIVSPDFLVALRNHSSLQDPFPKATDFFPTATDTSDFWDWKPDPKLLQNYSMISVDPSPEVEQAEGLALAAGASLQKFYEPKKKPTKAKIQAYAEHCKELLQEAADASPPKTVVLLASKTKSKYSNNNTTNFLKQLKEELSIPAVGSKILAKTITKQEAFLVGLEPNASNTTSNSVTAKSKQNQPKAADANRVDARETPQSPEWQLRKAEKSSLKREHEEVCIEKGATEMKEHSSKAQRGRKETTVTETENHEDVRSSKRRKVEPPKQEEVDDDEDFVLPANNDEPLSPDANSNNEPQSSNNKIIAFEKANSDGWFTAAPKDDRERSRLRQRASEAYRKETGIALEPSASTGFTIQIDAMTDSPNQVSNKVRGGYAVVRQRNNDNLPNFKRFRKNHVPRTDAEEVVILVDATFTQGNTEEEASAEELEMRENQRLAEALFSGEPVPGMVKKRRRARN